MSFGGRWAMPGRKVPEEDSDASYGAYENVSFTRTPPDADGDGGGGRRGRGRRSEREEEYSTSPSRRSSSSTKPPSGSRMGSISSDVTSPTLPMTPNTERRLRERSLVEVRQQLTDATNVAGRALAAGAKKGLQTLMEPMEPTEFGWFDALTALISVGMFYFDVVSDSLLAYSMYSDPSTQNWFLSTVLLLVIPLVIVNGFSVYWYWFDEKVCEPEGMCYRTPRVSPGVWAFRILSHILLQANILRYMDLLYYGYKSRRKGQVCTEARAGLEQHPDKFSLAADRLKQKQGLANARTADCHNYQKLWIHAERDAANVDLLASLLQDAPQLILQLYIMAHTVPAQALQGEISQTLMFQILSVAASLVAMSWSVSSFSRSTRLAEPTLGNLSPAGLLILTLGHFCSIAPQVLCFALFSTKYMIIFVVVISCHWLAASFFVIVQVVCCPNPVRLGATFTHDVRKGPCNRLDDVAFSASFGLVLLYTFIDVVTIYTRLKDFVKDDNDKLDSMYRKIATVYLEKEEPLSAAATLRELVTRLNEPAKITEAWRSIAQILSGTKDLPEEEAPKLEEALEHLLNESVLGENESNYQSYLRILYRLRKFPKLIVAAQNMLNIFPTYYPLEWICRTFVEMNAFPVDGEDKFPLSQEELSEYNLKLLTMNKASPWGNLAMGLTCKLENKPEEAKAYLRVGAERVSNNLLGWRLLLIVQEKINDWPGVEVSCKKIINILNSESKVTLPDNEDAESYSIKMHLMQAKALFYMGHMNHLKQAVAILDKLSGTDLESGILLVRSRIKLKEFNEAMDEIERLQSAHGKQPRLKLLLAILHRSRGESQEALQLLLEYVEEEPSVGEGHLELGRLYFEMGDLKKAQLCCMRAGKLDPTLGQAFLYLGHFFRRQDNMPKALKCYEKALSINPCDDDTGAALSDMYRILGEHDANIRLLRRVTSEAGRASCAWAWLRLGLHHLALHEYDKAIQAFHCTLTINPNDSASYECLGDAYLAYGAHTAALKVFTKAAEINPNALYPLYQIAHIKQMVGENLEAIADYEAVLERDPIPAVQVVSLVGLAEALIADARKSYEQFFHKNVKDDCVRAIPHLMRAASIKPESSSIWKLLGDACSLLFPIPPSLATFTVPAKLMDREVEDLQEMVDVDKLQVLQLGARCYAVALQIASNDASLWHDLAVNTYLQGHVMERDKGADEAAVKSLMERSLAALRKSLALEPTSGKIWNSLGLVASHKAVGELKLAQHALIKSTEHQPTAVNWTHLGGFYLVHEEPRLAHEAFSVAQALDPSFVTCWVGQALVAEAVGHYEAFDLFRHTTMLGIQVESCMGYTHHVSQLACDVTNEKKSRVQESVKQALPKVSDCMVYYTTEEERDPVGLNMAGLMLEMIGLYQSAAKAYEMALTALSESDESDTKFLDGVHCNLGRTLTAQGLVEEAMQQYSAIKEPDYFTQCGLALASLKAGKFEEAYNAYTAALHWLAPDDTQKSHILVALASLQYKFQNSEEAKKLLFQGSQLKGASVRGLFALAALGLVSGDAALTGAALAELRPHEHNPEYVHHVTFLRAAEATARSNMKEAKLILSKAIHQHPANAPLWQSLARHLLTMTTSSPASSQNNCVAAAACAASATRLAQAAGQHKTIAQDSVASVLATLASEGSKINQSRASLREAQRAVLMCPGSAEAWAMLVAARVAAGHAQRHQDVVRLAKMWAQQAPPKVAKWLNGITRQYARVA